MRKALPVVALALVAGCGGDDNKKNTTPPGKPDAQAKAVAQRYLDAYTARDPQGICSTLTAHVKKQLADNKGTCEKTMKFSLHGSGKFPKLVVSTAYADGPTALALIRGSKRQLTLRVESGEWKVDNGGQ